jgi:hypothetical protein
MTPPLPFVEMGQHYSFTMTGNDPAAYEKRNLDARAGFGGAIGRKLKWPKVIRWRAGGAHAWKRAVAINGISRWQLWVPSEREFLLEAYSPNALAWQRYRRWR